MSSDNIRSFYESAFKCPYIQKATSQCPFLKAQVDKCPVLSQMKDSSAPVTTPITTSVNSQGLLVPNVSK